MARIECCPIMCSKRSIELKAKPRGVGRNAPTAPVPASARNAKAPASKMSDRPLLSRKDTQRDNARQRREAIARDGTICRFERWSKKERRWIECGRHSTDTAHIYPRRECAGAVSHRDVVLRGCRDCHDAFDGHGDRTLAVRVPPDREAKAFRLISMASKAPVPRRKPPVRPAA